MPWSSQKSSWRCTNCSHVVDLPDPDVPFTTIIRPGRVPSGAMSFSLDAWSVGAAGHDRADGLAWRKPEVSHHHGRETPETINQSQRLGGHDLGQEPGDLLQRKFAVD